MKNDNKLIPTIPEKEFDELLTSSISEAASNRFSYETLLKEHSSTYSEVLKYVENSKQCKFVGTGSSRTAFYIKSGAIPQDPSSPCCLKVAKNEAGVSQMKAEADIFKKFKKKGKEYSCFPKIFGYDETNGFSVLMEIGTEATKEKIAKYFEDWNSKLKKETDLYSYGYIKDLGDLTWLAGSITNNIKKKSDYGIADDEKMKETINDPKYDTIWSFIEFTIDGGKKLGLLNDLWQTKNWAFVVRDGIKKLIPIDFGAVIHVIKKHYGYGKSLDK